MPLHEAAKMLLRVGSVAIEPVDLDLWLRAMELQWHHRDPADRIIVASAVRKDCPLVTTDEVIQAYYRKSLT